MCQFANAVECNCVFSPVLSPAPRESAGAVECLTHGAVCKEPGTFCQTSRPRETDGAVASDVAGQLARDLAQAETICNGGGAERNYSSALGWLEASVEKAIARLRAAEKGGA